MNRRQFLSRTGFGIAGGMMMARIMKPSKVEGSSFWPAKFNEKDLRLAKAAPLREVMNSSWPARSGIAIGGIGTGSAELRKDGRFYNWSICNNLPKGTGARLDFPEDSMLFFVVRYEQEGKEPRMKLLQINDGPDFGSQDAPVYYFPWLSCVENIEYRARFPFIKMKFSDSEMPVEVELEAFSPFIPHDVKNSSLPAMIFNFKVTSKSKSKVNVMLMASLRNAAGYDVEEKTYTTRMHNRSGYKACEMSCTGMDTKHSSFGTQALASLSSESTYYLGWEHRHPYYEIVLREKLLPNIDDTAARVTVDRKTGKKRALKRLFSTLAISREVRPKGSFEHTFVKTWHFPNLYNDKLTYIEGHYYSNFFNSAADIAAYVTRQKEDLYNHTKKFVDDFYDSSAEQYVLDQINSQLNTFVTSGRLVKSGAFGVQEGMSVRQSWGPVATIDVSLYGSVPILALFPELQKNMLRAHKRQQTAKGEIAHGLRKDFQQLLEGTAGVYHRLDLCGQYVIMVLRDFFWTNDREYLQEMWPSVKKAIEYILRERDFDSNSLPSMNGIECSYDNFPMYGMASYIVSQWLAAMASARLAAKTIGDTEAETKYAAILKRGSRLMDEKLWNGKYYRLYNDEGGEHGGIDEGCLTDQIIGQWAAHLSGLGDLFDSAHTKKALRSILEMSYKPEFGLRNCSWPGDKYWYDIPKDIWVDQANTCWTGVELAFASFLIYEGLYEEGMNVIKTVDRRYRKAGLYWDHQEFGGHYYRPMSAWAILNAMLGLSINQEEYSFSPKMPVKNLKLFFAFPSGTAHYVRNVKGSAERVAIKINTAHFRTKKLVLSTVKRNPQRAAVSIGDKRIDIAKNAIRFSEQEVQINFDRAVTVEAGNTLQIRIA